MEWALLGDNVWTLRIAAGVFLGVGAVAVVWSIALCAFLVWWGKRL